MKTNDVIIVAGLKRGGTSLIMQMLQKGGIETVVDELRDADKFNPKGYYEHQKIMDFDRKKPKPYALDFMERVKGKAVKVYAGLLRLLPVVDNLHYKVIFIERNIFEVWASRIKMNAQLQQKGNEDILFFAIRQRENLTQVIESVKLWLNTRKDVDILWLNYTQVVEHPLQQANRIQQFLKQTSGVDETEMIKAVDPNLYNEKATQLFLTTDRSPKAVAKLIDEYVADKIYCEIGIGEGHNLHAVKTAKHKFGIERTPYGVKRCKQLYPELEVKQGNFFNLYKSQPFDVCFLWIVYPHCKKIVDAILTDNEKIMVLMGINYYYHLPDGDEKKELYIKAYPKEAGAAQWNKNVDEHLQELNTKGFSHQIKKVTDDNGEIFSVAIIQKQL